MGLNMYVDFHKYLFRFNWSRLACTGFAFGHVPRSHKGLNVVSRVRSRSYLLSLAYNFFVRKLEIAMKGFS